jgi:hypothetical protein
VFWCRLEETLWRYGGRLNRLCVMNEKREVTFQKKRDRLPETWHINWRAAHKPIIRKALGCLIGKMPPDPGLPIMVPS